jgi:hypothetical protein
MKNEKFTVPAFGIFVRVTGFGVTTLTLVDLSLI